MSLLYVFVFSLFSRGQTSNWKSSIPEFVLLPGENGQLEALKQPLLTTPRHREVFQVERPLLQLYWTMTYRRVNPRGIAGKGAP